MVEFCGGPGTWVTRTYTAARNGGAFCNGNPIQARLLPHWGAQGSPDQHVSYYCDVCKRLLPKLPKLNVACALLPLARPCQVSKVHDVSNSLLVTGFGYEHDECWAQNMQVRGDATECKAAGGQLQPLATLHRRVDSLAGVTASQPIRLALAQHAPLLPPPSYCSCSSTTPMCPRACGGWAPPPSTCATWPAVGDGQAGGMLPGMLPCLVVGSLCSSCMCWRSAPAPPFRPLQPLLPPLCHPSSQALLMPTGSTASSPGTWLLAC